MFPVNIKGIYLNHCICNVGSPQQNLNIIFGNKMANCKQKKCLGVNC